jgi:PAS domain S-box-containing protein
MEENDGVSTRIATSSISAPGRCDEHFKHHNLRRTVTDRPTERIHVLHVDDDPDFLALVKQFLERVDADLRVISVEDVTTALERLRNDDRIECVLSDYDMPTLDGLDFLARVRELAPRLPFLLYTGRGDESIAARAITAGVNDYVQKAGGTTHYLELGVRIKREVQRRRAERETETRLAALEAARDGICILDVDGRVKYANAAYLDLYGYEHEELVGTRWERLHPESEVEFVTAEVLPHLDEHGEWVGEGVGPRADGTTFPESESIAALPEGELVVVATEYTESTTGSGESAAADGE